MRIRPNGHTSLLVVVLLALLMPRLALACAELPSAQKLESARYHLSFRTTPEKIVIGQHFSVEFVVCPRAGQPVPESVRIDATMPEHRHGMNYKPSIRSGEGGRYLAEGMLFHMTGRWEVVFEVRAAGQVDRLRLDQTM